MLSLGISQINNIISEPERQQIKSTILKEFNNKNLYDESGSSYYKNSYGKELKFDYIYDRLTQVVSDITELKLQKVNSYSRIYFNDSVLNVHRDRESLDLTLSIQIDNTFDFDIECPIYIKGYDDTVYETKLKNKDGVIIKGNELEHWRNPMVKNSSGCLMCIFFHWTIIQVEYQEVINFLDKQECDNIINIASHNTFQTSHVLQNYNETKIDINARSSKSLIWNYNVDELNKELIPYIGNLRLEDWELLKYNEYDKFPAHLDNGGTIKNRLYTILIYLNDDFKGGTTTFTNQGITLIPEMGKMVIFKNLKNKIIDNKSMHSGDTIISGTKFCLVNWANLLN